MSTQPNFFGTVLKAIACTRNRNFDKAAYQNGVVQPTKRIRLLMSECGDAQPTGVQIKEVLALLKQTFETKMVDATEQQLRFNEIYERNGLQRNSVEIAQPLAVPIAEPQRVAQFV